MTSEKKVSQDNRIGVGVVGAGTRGISCLGRWLSERYNGHKLRIAAICDNHPERLGDAENFLKAQFKKFRISDKFKMYNKMEELIADDDVEVVMITTPQCLHEKPFAMAAEAGKMIFCEKPLAHSQQACDNMLQVYRDKKPRCMIGFTRRYEPLWKNAKKMISDGAVGQPHMMLLRSVIPYHIYFSSWWRNKANSGDLINEKSSHHFDALNWFAESKPISLHAIGGRKVFVPRQGYPERCSECDRECPYRKGEELLDFRSSDNIPPFRLKYDSDLDIPISRDLCVFSPKADINDHAIVTLTFANGMVGCLFFSVFGQHTDDRETLEVIGNEGKLVLSRHAKTIDVASKFSKAKSFHKYEGPAFGEGHFGADAVVIDLLSEFCCRTSQPSADFEDAYIASKIAFLARESIADGLPKRIDY
ncbi:MAG: Gfo/Idh/MocA family protein [Planctomycetota bacterium]